MNKVRTTLVLLASGCCLLAAETFPTAPPLPEEGSRPGISAADQKEFFGEAATAERRRQREALIQQKRYLDAIKLDRSVIIHSATVVQSAEPKSELATAAAKELDAAVKRASTTIYNDLRVSDDAAKCIIEISRTLRTTVRDFKRAWSIMQSSGKFGYSDPHGLMFDFHLETMRAIPFNPEYSTDSLGYIERWVRGNPAKMAKLTRSDQAEFYYYSAVYMRVLGVVDHGKDMMDYIVKSMKAGEVTFLGETGTVERLLILAQALRVTSGPEAERPVLLQAQQELNKISVKAGPALKYAIALRLKLIEKGAK